MTKIGVKVVIVKSATLSDIDPNRASQYFRQIMGTPKNHINDCAIASNIHFEGFLWFAVPIVFRRWLHVHVRLECYNVSSFLKSKVGCLGKSKCVVLLLLMKKKEDHDGSEQLSENRFEDLFYEWVLYTCRGLKYSRNSKRKEGERTDTGGAIDPDYRWLKFSLKKVWCRGRKVCSGIKSDRRA